MTDIFLYGGEPNPSDVVLCDPTQVCPSGAITGTGNVTALAGLLEAVGERRATPGTMRRTKRAVAPIIGRGAVSGRNGGVRAVGQVQPLVTGIGSMTGTAGMIAGGGRVSDDAVVFWLLGDEELAA